MVHSTAARGFVRGDVYERGRAGYPDDVVGVMGITESSRVIDMGCGTGKLTRTLAFARTLGIEPFPAMLRTFREQLPGVPVVAGLAEAIPLHDAAVDVITCASAFHWFDHARAIPELSRVLRPNGKLAIIWNRRDSLTGWAAEFWQVTEKHRDNTPGYRTGKWREALEASPHFGPIEEHWFDHVQRTDVDGVVARVASISFIETSPKREAILAEAREFIENHPETRGKTEIELPYKTVVYLCENLGDA